MSNRDIEGGGTVGETTESSIKVAAHIRNLLLDQKNRSLIVNSVSSEKEFHFIYNFSVKHLGSKAREIDDALFSLNTEEITILNDMLQGVIKLCKDEWVGDQNPVEIINDDSLRKICSLCGQKNNKWVFNIKNRLNGNKMNVGSSCIDEFPSIELRRGKTRSMLENEALKKSRLQELTVEFPGIENIVLNWSKEVGQFEVLIPDEIDEQFQELGNELKGIYDDFIANKKDSELFSKINLILESRKGFISSMREYEEEHRDKEYIVTRKIVNWLKRHGKDQAIKILKQTGYVTYSTVSGIHEPEFLLKIAQNMNLMFDDTEIEIIDLDHEMKGFVVKPLKRFELKLICPFDSFLSNFSWVLFGENSHARYNVTNVFKSAKIYGRKSVEMVADDLRYRVNNSQISISLYDSSYNDYLDLNEIDIYDKKTKKVTVLNLMNFLEKFKVYAFGIEEVDVAEIRWYLEHLDKSKYRVHTPKELRQLREAGRDMSKRYRDDDDE